MLTADHALAIETTEARMTGVFTQRLASQPQPVTLIDRLRWRGAKARSIGANNLADGLERDADAVAQLQQALADTRTLLAEEKAKTARLNATIRRMGGAGQ